MADTIRVRPQPGLKFRRPDTKQLVGEEGFDADPNALFVAFALQHGDLVLVDETPPGEKPAKG